MTKSGAIRFLLNSGWEMVGEGYFRLMGRQETPVCVETAYELQKMMQKAA